MGSYFAAVDVRFWVKPGTASSVAPTSESTMTEVLNLKDASIQNGSTSQDVTDYSSPLGYGKKLVTASSYSIPCVLNLDPTSDGYKVIKRAARNAAAGVTLQWFRQLPIVGSGDTVGQCDAGVAIVSNLTESLANGNVATLNFTLEGQGAPVDYQQGSGIATLTITNPGLGLGAGTGVALVSTAPEQGNLSGRNATVTTTVNGSGVIQTATIVAPGKNYRVGDVLTIADPSVFGTGDTAPVLTVATVA